MNQMTPVEIQALLRWDVYAFAQKCFYELNPEEAFQSNGHLEVLAATLEEVWRGELRRLIVTLPPRGLKSLFVSVALVVFLLGHHPTLKILCVSYGQELAEKFARDRRRIMATRWYQDLFPTRISEEKNAASEFETTAGGYCMATSVNGVTTGRGADIIIVDDPQKPAEALSDTQRKTANDWFSTTLRSRLNDKKRGVMILVMQRLHEDDLVGHVMDREDWWLLSFPAIAEQDEEFEFRTWYGTRRFTRRAGEVLHPAREPLAVLQELQRSLGMYHFAAQYQQNPTPLDGGLVKRNAFQYYQPGEEPAQFDYTLQSWDTANKFSEIADYSVGTTWGIRGEHIYLRHVLRRKMNYAELRRTLIDHARLWAAKIILIEDKASGTALIDDLIHGGLSHVQRYEPKDDKKMRLVMQTGLIESGRVFLPAAAPWLEDYLHELTIFPNGKYDDQVDSTSQALDWIRTREFAPGMGLYRYAMQELEKAQSTHKTLIRLKRPNTNGPSHIITLSGRQLMVGDHGTIEVSEGDAGPLIAVGWTRR